VQSLSMRITDVTTVALGKGDQMTEKEVQFECHVASHISEGFVHIFNKCLIVGCFMFANKDVNNYIKCFPSSIITPTELCIKIHVLHKILNLRTSKGFFFDFLITNLEFSAGDIATTFHHGPQL